MLLRIALGYDISSRTGRLTLASSAFVHEVQLFNCTKNYSRGMGYVNHLHMLIDRQLPPSYVPSENERGVIKLV
jgi:hypothetical protein